MTRCHRESGAGHWQVPGLVGESVRSVVLLFFYKQKFKLCHNHTGSSLLLLHIFCINCHTHYLQFSRSCPTLCDPMDCSTPGFPVHHHLPEFIQTHVHWVSDAIQPSHPLSSPSPPAFSLFQHQGLFQWVSSSHQVAKNWSFSFNVVLPNEYSGLISFRKSLS